VDIGTCCQDVGDYCTFGEPDPGDEPAVCCSGLVCCETETSAACAECCGDSDCGPCAYCADGVCYGECSQSESCCNGQCVEDDDCCKPEGSICGVAPSDDSSQLDCCDGLVCCDNLYYGVSVCAECCVDADCAAGGWCDEGECKYPHACTDDKHCPKGTCCCKDGSCSGKCCHHPHPPKPPKPPKPAPAGGDVSTLPATGAGNASESGGLLGAVALGAAAAFFAAKKLRDDGTIDDRPEAG
jgi:LPXTG-motif cell wall-anchored protein